MGITRLEVSNFRNLQKVQLIPHHHINILIGPNGSGKTSVLEAIYLLGRGRSFRISKNKNLIRAGETRSRVFAEIDHDRPHRIGVEIEGNRFKGKLDGISLQRSSDLAKAFPLTLITPDSSKLVQSAPSLRRKFLELGLFHVKHDYFPAWQRYVKSLNQRNQALRRGEKGQAMIWAKQLVEYGGELDDARRDYISRYSEIVESILSELMAYNKLTIGYYPGWGDSKTFEDALNECFDSDLQRGFTQRGPHRADLRIDVDGKPAAQYLSGGQQRILACALILAQATLYQRMTHRGYTVLVDDFAAELDGESRGRFLTVLSNLKHQIFITVTGSDAIDVNNIGEHHVFHVKQGQITLNDAH